MDPFNALAIATALLQFTEFGIKILTEVNSLRKTGNTITGNDLANTAKECKDLTATLKKRASRRSSPESELLDQHEQALNDLLVQCTKTGDELAEVLESLQVRAKANLWESFSTAIKATWSAQKVKEKLSDLEKCQNQVAFRLLACINQKVDLLDSKLDKHHRREIDAAQENRSDIKEILTISNQDILREWKGQTSLLQHQLDQDRNDILAAVLTLNNGETRVLNGSKDPSGEDIHLAKSVMNLKFKRAGVQSPETRQWEPRRLGDMALTDFRDYKSRILDFLRFRHLKDRYDNIEPAHAKTFGWIFQNPSQHDDGLEFNFCDWLASDQPCYWVNGKAASGKSTLMKYIYNHPETKRCLLKWSSPGEMVLPSFFFYYLGTEMQKSQTGLFRSLLLSVLETRSPEFMLRVMPDLCAEVLKNSSAMVEEPKLPELRRWFRNMVAQANSELRFCFVIDGLDEYDGDLPSLIDLIKATFSPDVKYLVSSRPITACSEAFAACPNLMLQNLTVQDIREYIQAHLGSKLQDKDERYHELVDMLVDKASGVFLWVVLVVNSLLEGLRDGDTFDELLDRTEKLPPDLKQLFSVMLQRVLPQYRASSSRLLELMLASLQVDESPISALQLSYTQDRWEDIISARATDIGRLKERNRCRDLEARIKSRCCGLLELNEVTEYHARTRLVPKSQKPVVRFIHKTAVEYLDQYGIPMAGESQRAVTSTPYEDLFKSCIALLKSFRAPVILDNAPDDSWGIAWDAIGAALSYALCAQTANSPVSITHWDELSNAVSRWWKDVHGVVLHSKTGYVSLARPWTWSAVYLAQMTKSPAEFFSRCPSQLTTSKKAEGRDLLLNMAMIAFRWDLAAYLEAALARIPDETGRCQQSTWLLQVLAPMASMTIPEGQRGWRPGKKFENYNMCSKSCCDVLLRHGADPMASVVGGDVKMAGHSVYVTFLEALLNEAKLKPVSWDDALEEFEETALLFITYGAPANIGWGGKSDFRSLRQRLWDISETRVIHLRAMVSSYDDGSNRIIRAPLNYNNLNPKVERQYNGMDSHGLKRRWLRKRLNSLVLRRY